MGGVGVYVLVTSDNQIRTTIFHIYLELQRILLNLNLTFEKLFPSSFSMAAFQVRSLALSRRVSMSAIFICENILRVKDLNGFTKFTGSFPKRQEPLVERECRIRTVCNQ